MAADVGKIIGGIVAFLFEHGDDAVAVVSGVIGAIGKPKYTDEEIEEKLADFLDGTQRDALRRLLASPGIQVARARLDALLGEDDSE